jgi:hypothetical protein
LLYFISNLLIGLSIFLYQTGKPYTLILNVVATLALLVTMYMLYSETWNGWVMKNLVGAVLGWAVIGALMSLGQWAVVDLKMERNLQAIIFFFLAAFSILSFAIWNRYDGAGKTKPIIGLCASGGALILLSAVVAW